MSLFTPSPDRLIRFFQGKETLPIVGRLDKKELHKQGELGRTPMVIAAANGRLDKLPGMIKKNQKITPADLTTADRDGWTALHFAAQCRHLKQVGDILPPGQTLAPKDFLKKNQFRATAFDKAFENKQLEQMIALLPKSEKTLTGMFTYVQDNKPEYLYHEDGHFMRAFNKAGGFTLKSLKSYKDNAPEEFLSDKNTAYLESARKSLLKKAPVTLSPNKRRER